MGITETLILYLIIGVVVTSTLRVVGSHSDGAPSLLGLATWLMLWPFFAPAILGHAVSQSEPHPQQHLFPTPPTRLHAAQNRLLEAIRSLDGLAESVLSPQVAQIEEMMQSLNTAENRLGEMDKLLGSQEFDLSQVDAALGQLHTQGYGEEEPRVRSLHARRRNIERLQTMRDRTREELERALVRLEEMSSQVMLLRFADQPETRLANLLKDVADNVDDVAGAVLELSEL